MARTTKARPKAELKNKQEARDCYIPGCYNIKVESCEGIPVSNRCASCKRKKAYMGVIDD